MIESIPRPWGLQAARRAHDAGEGRPGRRGHEVAALQASRRSTHGGAAEGRAAGSSGRRGRALRGRKLPHLSRASTRTAQTCFAAPGLLAGAGRRAGVRARPVGARGLARRRATARRPARCAGTCATRTAASCRRASSRAARRGTPIPAGARTPATAQSLDVIYADRDGERAIPPGRYHVTVTRGFEYTLPRRTSTSRRARRADVEARARARRRHARLDLGRPARACGAVARRACAARGPRALARGVGRRGRGRDRPQRDHRLRVGHPRARPGPWLASIVGDEVTTRGVPLGHFNVFPLAPGPTPAPLTNHATARGRRVARRARPRPSATRSCS